MLEHNISHTSTSVIVTAVKTSYLTFQYFNGHGNRCEDTISHKPVDLLVTITTVRISYNISVPLVVLDSCENMTHTTKQL